ncbi:hypothetical protein D3C84_1214830 [compost metagenome]
MVEGVVVNTYHQAQVVQILFLLVCTLEAKRRFNIPEAKLQAGGFAQIFKEQRFVHGKPLIRDGLRNASRGR